MGWTYKHQKLRDALREKYQLETGRNDFTSPEFEQWLKDRGELT